MKRHTAQHEFNRILIGNQIAIMRALAQITNNPAKEDLNIRVHDIKDWWRHIYEEEVGFSSAYSDSIKK